MEFDVTLAPAHKKCHGGERQYTTTPQRDCEGKDRGNHLYIWISQLHA